MKAPVKEHVYWAGSQLACLSHGFRFVYELRAQNRAVAGDGIDKFSGK